MFKFWVPLLCAAVLASSSYAQMQPVTNFPVVKKKAKKAKKAKKDKAVSVIQFDRGSEEAPQERETRLRRECKGGVNAGACLGYVDTPVAPVMSFP